MIFGGVLLVKADRHRNFTGAIKRDVDSPIVSGSVTINEGKIYSMASSEDKLCRNLDILCVLKLDHGIHRDAGLFIGVCGGKYFLN